jgi:hypothetical protein
MQCCITNQLNKATAPATAQQLPATDSAIKLLVPRSPDALQLHQLLRIAPLLCC